MRTTIVLDDDVIERVKEDCRKREVSFKENLNELVRAGLLYRTSVQARKPFRVKATDMGMLPGVNYDNTNALLDYAEGEGRRW